MRFEHIILMIIAFNVVSAVIQRRAKKRAEAEQAAGSHGADPATPMPEAERDEGERLPGFGRDILDQLARDLGLKVPRPQAPAPESAPRPPAPHSSPKTSRGSQTPRPSHPSRGVPREVPPPTPVRREERRTVSFPERPAVRTERVVKERVPERVRPASVPGVSVPPAAVSVVSVTEQAPQGALKHRIDLKDPARLREAFILKEILDVPVARRPQRPHRS